MEGEPHTSKFLSLSEISAIMGEITLQTKFSYTVKDVLQRKTHCKAMSLFPVYTIEKIMCKYNESLLFNLS